jgi:hypothetical protein
MDGHSEIIKKIKSFRVSMCRYPSGKHLTRVYTAGNDEPVMTLDTVDEVAVTAACFGYTEGVLNGIKSERARVMAAMMQLVGVTKT